MVKTLVIGSCVSVQGRLVRNLADGRIVIAVGDRQFTGYPPTVSGGSMQNQRASAT